MAHYVMSDIHGEADRFHAMLEKIRFSSDDTLYILGDVIDRGVDGINLLLEIMEMPNVVMLLGNHEYMMLQYLSHDATDIVIRRWNRNGNAPTLAAYLKLKAKTQQRILDYLNTRPSHLEVDVNGRRFYLVHAWPGENVHDEVWQRPEIVAANPKPGYQVIIGHTKVLSMIKPEEARIRYTAHAVTLCMQQQERLLLVTKWLYPDVAKHYGTNWRAVERNIRTASAIAWERNRPLLEALAQRRLKRRPRSTEFLALLFHAVQPKELMTGGLEQP